MVYDELKMAKNYVALFADITLAKKHEQQLKHIANFDPLTNLPNRLLLADRLQQGLIHSRRHGLSLAVIYLDLDGFKEVNDVHGHDVGDKLLIAVSLSMKEALRDGDTLARFGGDEFVGVLVDLEHPQDCEPILERILSAASEPVTLNNHEFQVSASIGVSVYPQDNVDADLLIRHADHAMYIAKQNGKNRFHYFNIQQEIHDSALGDMLINIERALSKDEFRLYIQPKLDLNTGVIVGAESLVRWIHPDRGIIQPIDFLPWIEKEDIAIDLGEWVIRDSLRLLDEWSRNGLKLPLSINISAHQFNKSNFHLRLAAILKEFPLVEPRFLEIEIVESVALSDLSKVCAIIDECKALGVKFSLDDFGTGYSSLTYLKQLSVDTLKIDQSFVQNMEQDKDDLAIVRGVIGLAKAFNCTTVAEGMEKWEQASHLKNIGCNIAQGYAIARPMPEEELTAWIDQFKMPSI